MKLVLGSKSPRRKELLKDLGFSFRIATEETDESYPDELSLEEIPVHIAIGKAQAILPQVAEDEYLLTSDTIVAIDGAVLGKPKDKNEAKAMLRLLSDRMHYVITGICLISHREKVTESVTTKVHFKELSTAEINYYVDNYPPLDKAGGYGIQEWIGDIAVTKIEGSYTNVVGLPTNRVYEILQTIRQ